MRRCSKGRSHLSDEANRTLNGKTPNLHEQDIGYAPGSTKSILFRCQTVSQSISLLSYCCSWWACALLLSSRRSDASSPGSLEVTRIQCQIATQLKDLSELATGRMCSGCSVRSHREAAQCSMVQKRTLVVMAYCNEIDKPPSTSSCAPVTYLLKSLARKIAGPARSSGSPTLPSGVRVSRYFSFSALARSSAAS
jgi:hypothetical protein